MLLTNDDGIDAEGIQTLRRALAALDDIELAVVAPDENQSATARSVQEAVRTYLDHPRRVSLSIVPRGRTELGLPGAEPAVVS